MDKIRQAPDRARPGLALQQRRLLNHTESLQQANIANAVPFADGAFANVYKITMANQQCVAVKCVKHTSRYKKLKRASRELSCWSSYTHENILPLLGFAVLRDDLAMVSPWMRNGYVTVYVVRNPSCNRLGLCAQLAQAISYLHENRVVHGDIKGVTNVLVSDEGTIQITDFGVSITDHQEIEFSETSTGQGTQRWQVSVECIIYRVFVDEDLIKAPEILLGLTGSTKEADVYALAMTMIVGSIHRTATIWIHQLATIDASGDVQPPTTASSSQVANR
ncbi:kinase-like protein [Rhizoctonia solani]|uniref:Kinase-like protein n=1 Tax=Rhizoctonia solani TaxID=456999 RepID=A0A8H7M2P7_9AGAM|nr:kinase-like protein [Rhizoctonia solani]